MLNGHEQLMAQLRREFKPGTVAKVRKAQITAAASPSSYSVLLPGETIDRDSVQSISPVVPIVGDFVRVDLVGDEPAIVAVYGRGRIKQATTTSGTGAVTSLSYIVSGLGTDVLTQDLVAGQQVLVHIAAKMQITSGTGHAAVLSFRVTGPGSTYGPNDDDSCETDSADWSTCSKTTLFTAPATGTHTFTLMFKAITSGTANFAQRRLAIWE